jgi:cobalt/nickel transport system permease protein
MTLIPLLWAVHISDGVLSEPVWAAGWIAAFALVAVSTWRVRDDEIPRIGVLTAAFFVASQIHLPLGGASVHLLLNGLLGVVLGRRAPLALAVGLLLQALLFGHGGVTTLGVNVTVYSIPALIAGLVFPWVWRRGWLCIGEVRFAAVSVSSGVWLASALTAAQWVGGKLGNASLPASAPCWVCDPMVAGSIAAAAAVVGVLERRVEKDPNFPIGLLLGTTAAYATVGLDCLILWAGGKDEVRDLAGVVVLGHLPVVVVESVGVGFVVAFLARAKPEWLAGYSVSGNTSSNGTSH